MRILVIFSFVGMICTCAGAEMRTWSTASGETVEGEYTSELFDNVVIANSEGVELKIPKDSLSKADREYIALINPPKLIVDILRSAKQDFPKPSPIWTDRSGVVELTYQFGARMKDGEHKDYPFQLTAEVYPIASQKLDASKYYKMGKLVSKPFVLSKDNGYKFEFEHSREFEVLSWNLSGQYTRGREFAESLVLVRDKRGEIIASNSTKKWLVKNLDDFLELPVGAWFDNRCKRVHPTQPERH